MIKGMLFAFLAAFSWGAAIVMSKKGVEELDAGGVFFWQICSAVILSWIVPFTKRKKFPSNSKAILAYVTGVSEPLLAYTFTLYGFYSISAGSASIIFSFESVFILVLSVLICSIKINSPQHSILFLIGVIVGSILVALPDINNGSNSIVGYCLVATGVLSTAFHVVISSRLIKSFEPITLSSGQLTFSLILSSLFIFILKSSIHLPLEFVIIVSSSGILQYFLAFCFYSNSLCWLPIHLVGVMLYFIPLVALFLSWLFLDEQFTFLQGVGPIVTVLNVYFPNKKYSEEQHSVQDCPSASIDTVSNARKKWERFRCWNVTKRIRGALRRFQGSQIETFVTKRSKDPLEILLFCAQSAARKRKNRLAGWFDRRLSQPADCSTR